MAKNIPGNNKPGMPQFKLTGEQVITENPATTTTLTSSTVDAWLTKSGSNFTQQDVILMNGATVVEIADPDGKTPPTYGSGDFVGGKPFSGTTIGNNLEIYYTINGKDPVRTKAYLYTGSFELNDNKSGSDNTIIKARSYYRGQWSDVAKIELRISNVSATITDIGDVS